MALDNPSHIAALTSRFVSQAHLGIGWNPTIAGQRAHRSARAYRPEAYPESNFATRQQPFRCFPLL